MKHLEHLQIKQIDTLSLKVMSLSQSFSSREIHEQHRSTVLGATLAAIENIGPHSCFLTKVYLEQQVVEF